MDRLPNVPGAGSRQLGHYARVPERLRGEQIPSSATREVDATAHPRPALRPSTAESQFTVFDTYLKRAPHYEAQAAALNHADFVAHGYVKRILTHSENAEMGGLPDNPR